MSKAQCDYCTCLVEDKAKHEKLCKNAAPWERRYFMRAGYFPKVVQGKVHRGTKGGHRVLKKPLDLKVERA